jgi:YggT family protein
MAYITSILSGIISVYMLLICVRIILTWFPGAEFGGLMIFLRSICDPYLDWFRRFRLFKNSPLHFSPLLALAVLSLTQGILEAWGTWGRLSLGVILAMLLGAVWSVVSWVLGFFIIILLLRLAAFLGNFNIYSPFWRFIDSVSQPVMYRICRVLFPARIISYLSRIVVSIAVLLLITIALWAVVSFGSILLRALPV